MKLQKVSCIIILYKRKICVIFQVISLKHLLWGQFCNVQYSYINRLCNLSMDQSAPVHLCLSVCQSVSCKQCISHPCTVPYLNSKFVFISKNSEMMNHIPKPLGEKKFLCIFKTVTKHTGSIADRSPVSHSKQ